MHSIETESRARIRLRNIKNKKVVWVAVVLLLIAIPVASVCAVKLSLALKNAQTLNSDLQRFKSSSWETDIEDLKFEILNLAKEASTANRAAHDPILGGLEFLPLIGKDFSSFQEFTTIADQLGRTSKSLVLSFENTRHGQVTLAGPDALSKFESALTAFEYSAVMSQQRLKKLSASQLHFGMSTKAKAIAIELEPLLSNVTKATRIVNSVYPILDNPEKSTWFIAEQNLAESRGTGGIVGSYLVLRSWNGKLKLIDSGSDAKLNKIAPVPEKFQESNFVQYWGIDQGIWQDLNVSADFQQAARTISRSYETGTGTKIDGVLFLGQGTLANLLAAYGDVNIGNQKISYLGIADYLAKGIYEDFPNVEEKNKVVENLGVTLFSSFATKQLNLQNFWNGLSLPYGDFPVVWEAKPEREKIHINRKVSGHISQKMGPSVWVAVNDIASNKIDAYGGLAANYKLLSCGYTTVTGLPARKGQVEVSIKNTAPKAKLPTYVWSESSSNQRWQNDINAIHNAVSIYAPAQSSGATFEIDGLPALAHTGIEGSRTVYTLRLNVAPNKTSKLRVTWLEPVADFQGRSLSDTPSLHLPPRFLNPQVEVGRQGRCR